MSALRTLSVRSWVLWSLLLVAAFSLGGCKKKAPEGEQPKAKSEAKAPEGKEQPVGEPNVAPAPVEQPSDGDVKEATAPAAATPEATLEPVEPPPELPPPTGSAVYATDQDKERMAELFAEMWCAELRGATKDQLFELYHKFDYPPLDRWHDDWNAVLVDRNWVRETVARARSRCPEAARNAELNAPPVAPTKPVSGSDLPAPPSPESDAKAAPGAPVASDGGANSPTMPPAGQE